MSSGVRLVTVSHGNGSPSKLAQTEWLQHREFISSQFWRLEVQHQGVAGLGFFSGLCPWLTGHCPVIALHILDTPLYMGDHGVFLAKPLLIKDTFPVRWGPTLLPSLLTESLRKRSCLQIQSHPEVQDMNLGRHNCAHNSNPNVSGSQSGRDLASASCFQLRLSPREAWHRLLAHIRRQPELTHYHLPNWTQVCNFCSFQFQSMTVKENWICNGIVFFPVGTQQSTGEKMGGRLPQMDVIFISVVTLWKLYLRKGPKGRAKLCTWSCSLQHNLTKCRNSLNSQKWGLH